MKRELLQRIHFLSTSFYHKKIPENKVKITNGETNLLAIV